MMGNTSAHYPMCVASDVPQLEYNKKICETSKVDNEVEVDNDDNDNKPTIKQVKKFVKGENPTHSKILHIKS